MCSRFYPRVGSTEQIYFTGEHGTATRDPQTPDRVLIFPLCSGPSCYTGRVFRIEHCPRFTSFTRTIQRPGIGLQLRYASLTPESPSSTNCYINPIYHWVPANHALRSKKPQELSRLLYFVHNAMIRAHNSACFF